MTLRDLIRLLTSRDREVFGLTDLAVKEHFQSSRGRAITDLKLFDRTFRPSFEGCLFSGFGDKKAALRLVRFLKVLHIPRERIRVICFAKPYPDDRDDGSELAILNGWIAIFGNELDPDAIVLRRRPNQSFGAARRWIVIRPTFPSGSMLRASKGFSLAVRFAARYLTLLDGRKRAAGTGTCSAAATATAKKRAPGPRLHLPLETSYTFPPVSAASKPLPGATGTSIQDASRLIPDSTLLSGIGKNASRL